MSRPAILNAGDGGTGATALGSTLGVTSGTLDVVPATPSLRGAVKPDNVTISADASGKLSLLPWTSAANPGAAGALAGSTLTNITIGGTATWAQSLRINTATGKLGLQIYGSDPGGTAGNYNFNYMAGVTSSKIGGGGFVSTLQLNNFPAMDNSTNSDGSLKHPWLRSATGGLPAASFPLAANTSVRYRSFWPQAIQIDAPSIPSVGLIYVDMASPSTLVLDYGLPLDSSSVPAETDFTLTTSYTAHNSYNTGTPVSAVSSAIVGSQVRLSLSRPVVWGENVFVQYTPRSNPIQFVSGRVEAATGNIVLTTTGATSIASGATFARTSDGMIFKATASGSTSGAGSTSVAVIGPPGAASNTAALAPMTPGVGVSGPGAVGATSAVDNAGFSGGADATLAAGNITITATDAVVIDAGAVFTRGDGAVFTSNGQVSAPGAGTVSVPVTSAVAGASENTSAGTSMTITSGVSGPGAVGATAAVDGSGLTGGANATASAGNVSVTTTDAISISAGAVFVSGNGLIFTATAGASSVGAGTITVPVAGPPGAASNIAPGSPMTMLSGVTGAGAIGATAAVDSAGLTGGANTKAALAIIPKQTIPSTPDPAFPPVQTGAAFVSAPNSPLILSATIASGSSTLTLNYSTALDTAQVPLTAAYSITSGDPTNPVTVTSVSVSGSTVTLGLSRPIGSGESDTVQYVAPGADGVELEAFGAGVVSGGHTFTTADMVAENSGVRLSGVSNSNIYGHSVGVTVDSGAIARFMVGYEPDMVNNGAASYRVGFHALAAPGNQGTVGDSAFAVISSMPNGPSVWRDALTLENAGGRNPQPISDYIIRNEGDFPFTVLGGMRLRNMTFNGPFIDLTGANMTGHPFFLGSNLVLGSDGKMITRVSSYWGAPGSGNINNGQIEIGNQVNNNQNGCFGECFVIGKGSSSGNILYNIPMQRADLSGKSFGGTVVFKGSGVGGASFRLTRDGAAASAANVISLPGPNTAVSLNINIVVQAHQQAPKSWLGWAAMLYRDGSGVTHISAGTTPTPINPYSVSTTVSLNADDTLKSFDLEVIPPNDSYIYDAVATITYAGVLK